MQFAPPRFGEHNEAVLTELGFDRETIARYVEKKVVQAGSPATPQA